MNLETLRALNPDLRIDAVTDASFAPYGRVLPLDDTAALHRALQDTPIPDEGNRYSLVISIQKDVPFCPK